MINRSGSPLQTAMAVAAGIASANSFLAKAGAAGFASAGFASAGFASAGFASAGFASAAGAAGAASAAAGAGVSTTHKLTWPSPLITATRSAASGASVAAPPGAVKDSAIGAVFGGAPE